MKRLGHKKSRNGCERCKQRRVKCDETRPCAACRRHGLQCSLLSGPDGSIPRQDNSSRFKYGKTAPPSQRDFYNSAEKTASTASGASSPPTLENTSSPRESKRPSPGESIPFFSRLLRGALASDCTARAGNISDVELIHHYTARAYATISSTTQINEILQYSLPREAFSSPSLLHQIMAFSAFHLAYTSPAHRYAYLFAASQHQGKAISLLRCTLAESLTPQNCHSAYATSMLLIISAFATCPSFEVTNPAFAPIDSLSDVFALVAGMAVILNCSDKHLREGPLKGLFGQQSPFAMIRHHLQALIDQLGNTRARLARCNPGSGEEDNRVVIDATTALIDSIAQSELRNVLGTPAELRAAFRWPIQLGNQFIGLLRRRQPEAMVVLAHYAVLLHYGESTCWFLKHWAFALIMSIIEHLEGTPYEEMITWCIETAHQPGEHL